MHIIHIIPNLKKNNQNNQEHCSKTIKCSFHSIKLITFKQTLFLNFEQFIIIPNILLSLINVMQFILFKTHISLF